MRRLLAAALAVLALPAAGAARPTGGTPVALVATASGARLAMVEVWTGRERSEVRLPGSGRDVASTIDTRRVLVATPRGVTLADMRAGRILARFRLDDPVAVEISPNGRRGFVLERGRGTLTVLDLVRRRVAGRVVVGPGPRALALSDNRVWVAHETGDVTLAVVDAVPGARPVVTAGLPAGGPVSELIHLPDSAWLLVAYRGSGGVAKLDAGIHARVVFRRGIGAEVTAIGLAWLTADLWIAGRDGRITVLSSRTGARLRSVHAGAEVRAIGGLGSYVAAATARDVRLFVPGGRRVATTPVAGGIAGVAFAVV